MKIAIMADIHSNLEAFKTCYEEAKRLGVSEYIFLGDYLGDMANPRETLRLLYEIRSKYPCTFIRGNKEEYWINHRQNVDEVWESKSTITGMLEYNYARLSNDDIDFFEYMDISKKMHYEGLPEFIICHGSPFKVNQSMRPDYEYIDQLVEKIKSNMVICGHFHIQTEYERNGVIVLNPGAVGVPLHSEGKTQFMILCGEEGIWKYKFITLSYDRNATIKSMNDEELYIKAPGWYEITKHLLLTEKTSHASAVHAVMENYYKETGIHTLHDIPEMYWKKEIMRMVADSALRK